MENVLFVYATFAQSAVSLLILPVLSWNVFYPSSDISFPSSIAFTYKQMCVKQFRNMPERNMIFPSESINPVFFLYYLYNSYKWYLHNSAGRLSKWNVNAVLVWEKIHVDSQCSVIIMPQDHIHILEMLALYCRVYFF